MSYKILVAVHRLDEYIDELVSVTDNLCKHTDSKLMLLHVLPDLADINRTETTLMLTQAHELLGAFADKLCCNKSNIEMRVQMGKPEDEILKCTLLEQINIVAMPTNGHTGINRLLLGSVAEHIIRHAQCPVVTTRKHVNIEFTPKPIKRILLPLDGSIDSMKVIPTVCYLAVLHDAEVTLFYDEAGLSEDQYASDDEAKNRNHIDAVKSALTESDIPVKLQTSQFKNPVEEIRRIVKELDIDLVAMTTHGRTGISRLVLGSVAEQYLHTSTCPLLTLSTAPTGSYSYEEQHLG